MISSVLQLQQYTEALAAKFPIIAKEIRLTAGGLDNEELSTLPFTLPDSYLSQVMALNLYGVAIGFFMLWPTFDRKNILIEALIRANSDINELVNKIRSQDILVVGLYEVNYICVDADGLVFLIDTMSSPTPSVVEIASDFEVFLLLAGNSHEISERYEGDPSASAAEMKKCCVSFSCGHEQIEFWEKVAMEMAS